MHTITANGKKFSIGDYLTLDRFLSQMNVDKRWVVVELNGEPLNRDQITVTPLRDGDKLEIVIPIAGG